MLAAAAAQHGVLTHAQLVALGLPPDAIKHRVARGKLHRVHRGVYAVGRPELDRKGQRKAALLACSFGAALSHSAGLEHWRLGPPQPRLELTICPPRRVRIPGLRIHQSRTLTAPELVSVEGIITTDPLRTLTDLATRWTAQRVDDAIERMHHIDLRSPAQLANQLDGRRSIPGSAMVRDRLDRWTISLTDSQLERRMVPIAKRAGISSLLTQQEVNGFRVDFYVPELGLIIEADSLRWHRTAARQTADARRDQAHIAAGLTPLRFTHAQITYAPQEVERTLRRVAAQCRRRAAAS